MDPFVVLRLPDGSRATLRHGDLVGRLETAALHIADPRISEAHAMVSLRGATLKLLALRGRLAVEGFAVRDVELVAGLTIALAGEVVLVVERVGLPEQILGLAIGNEPPRMASGVSSLLGGAEPMLRPSYVPDALAWFWPEGGELVMRRPGAPDEVLGPGDAIALAGVPIAVRAIDMRPGRTFATTDHGLATEAPPPLELVARYTSAHIRRAGARTLVISGLAARILSELVQAAVPMPWASLARELWPEETSDQELRAKWDVTLSRLRKKLVAGGVRADLVRADGHGNIELCLAPGDSAHDET